MRRLQAVEADVEDENFIHGFVSPVLIDNWVDFLKGLRPRVNPSDTIHPKHRRNIGYRIQLAEFECALLLLNLDTKRKFIGRSTLHESICSMKIQQFVVLAHSVLEGIGAHLVRADRRARGLVVDAHANINAPIWRTALVEEIVGSPEPPDISGESLTKALSNLTKWRDRIHMDRVEPLAMLHFDEFTYEERFVPAHSIFRVVLTALGLSWPAECCLNEAIE